MCFSSSLFKIQRRSYTHEDDSIYIKCQTMDSSIFMGYIQKSYSHHSIIGQMAVFMLSVPNLGYFCT